MINQVNRTIERISKKPLEGFSNSVLIGGLVLVLLSWAILLACLIIPIHIRSDSGYQTQTLGSLLWKVRTNR
jgi:hypothetical protein